MTQMEREDWLFIALICVMTVGSTAFIASNPVHDTSPISDTLCDETFVAGEYYACRAMGGYPSNGGEHRYCLKNYTDRKLTSILFKYWGAP